MLRRSLSTLAGVATRAQAARAGCVANLNAPSYFSTVASSGMDQREKSDRLAHSRLAVAAAWRGMKCARLDASFEVMARGAARKTTGTRPDVSGDTRARRRRSLNRSTRACGPSSALLGLFFDRIASLAGTIAFGFFQPRSRPSSDPRPPSANPTAGYATDIATTSANSGAITAALKTPTADIRYAPITQDPPKISPPQRASSRWPASLRLLDGAQSEKHPFTKKIVVADVCFAFFSASSPRYDDDRYDDNNHSIDKPGDPSKRAFTYFVLTGGRVIYASALRLVVLKFLLSMSASADVLALASLEVDLSKIEVGQTVTVKWRGKPVFIRRRTPAEIEKEVAVDSGELRDPQADTDRAQNPEWLVVVGVCTHLGCVPISNAGDYNGWFCPCHGSHYDASGRIRKGPAPYNLEVPEYKFLDETKMIVG